MEQTKAGSRLVDRAEGVAYLKAPTPATFLHYAVSQPCCRLWSGVLVMVPSCGQTRPLPSGLRPRDANRASVPHSQPPRDSTWPHTTTAFITCSMSEEEPHTGSTDALVEVKRELCGESAGRSSAFQGSPESGVGRFKLLSFAYLCDWCRGFKKTQGRCSNFSPSFG